MSISLLVYHTKYLQLLFTDLNILELLEMSGSTYIKRHVAYNHCIFC